MDREERFSSSLYEMSVSSASCSYEHWLPEQEGGHRNVAGADPGDPEILQRNMTKAIVGLEQLSHEGRQK